MPNSIMFTAFHFINNLIIIFKIGNYLIIYLFIYFLHKRAFSKFWELPKFQKKKKEKKKKEKEEGMMSH